MQSADAQSGGMLTRLRLNREHPLWNRELFASDIAESKCANRN